MKKCPFCAEEIQDEAIKCRYCGEFLDERMSGGRRMAFGYPWYPWGIEYQSRAKLFGLPLVHIARGWDPVTGRLRVARGIIAIGNIAIGLVAIGGLAFGGFALGGLGIGLFVLGGIALGGVALGGMSLALFFAAGGVAASTMYAIGGLAIAPHAIGSTGADPDFVQQLERWWPGIRDAFRENRG